MQKEWDNLRAIGTVPVMDCPNSAHVLPNLWTVNIKVDSLAKGRLVIEGSREVPGRDFDVSMTWAGVAVWPSVQRILAEATRKGRVIVVTDLPLPI